MIGYTLKNKDNDWFYAQKRNVTQTPFYTSNDKPFPVILRADGQSVNFEDTKKLLVPMIPLLSDDLKAEAQDFADNATADKVEIKTIEGVKILFVRTAPHTKVFFASPKSIFQNAFKGGNADLSKIKYDLTKAEAANWVDTTKTITAYNPITKDGEVIGYALKNKDNDWFYAPLRLDIVNFYGSNNGKLKVVMQDEKTVDLAQTKKLLVPQIPLLPANLQAEAQDFADNATDADVKIEEIEGVKLLFVKTSKHTKVFRTPDTDTMFQNAFKGGQEMNIGVVYTDAIVKPDWVDTSKKVTHYNEIKKADKVIGYALKTEDHHWFYAPKKEFTITPFYTSNNNIVPVVMKDPMTIDLPATKSVLYPLIKDITNPKDKAFAETFIKTATEKDVEIKEIKDVKVLFVNLGTSTKAFAGEVSSPFQNAFKEGTAINANIVYHSPIKPTWATSSDVKKYNEIKKADKLIGYTLKDADNHWFYASAAHRVNFDTDGATAIADQSIPLDGKATKPTDPSKAGYRFDGWFADKAFKTAFDFTKVITEHTTVYAKWTRRSSGGGSSGGSSSGGSSSGGSSSGGSSSGGSSSSASSASSRTVSAVSTPGVEEVVLPGEVTTPVCSVEGSTFSSEQNDAYLWACAQDITTIRSITQARLEDGLTRAELAKMMAVYVTKILGKTLVVTGSADYADVDASLGDLAEYIQLAYQLQIMGIHADGSALMNFNPHQTVTRAEFATVFSRVLFGNSYNQSGEQWYAQHLHALQKVGILQNTTATMQELRGWVLLMLQRAAQLK